MQQQILEREIHEIVDIVERVGNGEDPISALTELSRAEAPSGFSEERRNGFAELLNSAIAVVDMIVRHPERHRKEFGPALDALKRKAARV